MNKYEYRDMGFEGISLFGGVEVVQTMFGEGVEIQALEQLHREIFKAVCLSSAKLTPDMIRAIRAELDMSQDELGKYFGQKDRQSVSLYERGKDMPKPHQMALKSLLLSRISGAVTSVRRFQLAQDSAPPEEFVFHYDGTSWEWSNSPHQDDFQIQTIESKEESEAWARLAKTSPVACEWMG